MVQLLGKTVGQFLRKAKKELPCDPAVPLLDIYPKECKEGLEEISSKRGSKPNIHGWMNG